VTEIVSVEPVDPRSAAAGRILRRYWEEIVRRYHGRPATPDELAEALRVESSEDLALPHGIFLVARCGGEEVGCGGLRLLPDAVGELTRVYVAPSLRGTGLGTRLMAELEAHAAAHGARELRLDVRSDLVEALGLYARLGFEETAPFNASPYAGHWLRKPVAPAPSGEGGIRTLGRG
jgi:ribosomal protein S18 acetylase RimI-like enzyme